MSMNTFTASNGITVTDLGGNWDRSSIQFEGMTSNVDTVRTITLEDADLIALREFEQARRDEELGRWRWPENPDYVAYSRRDDGQVGIFCESTGVTVYRYRGEVKEIEEVRRRSGDEVTPPTHAARAYFEAHPERKPWEDAKPGEVWLFRGRGDKEPSAFMKSLDGWTNSEGVTIQRDPALPYRFSRDESFEPRRIWPEES